MRVISFNANGIRSAATKGFFDWLVQQQADVVCLQEVRADISELPPEIATPPGYLSFHAQAKKKGYSGVTLFCKQPPDRVVTGLGWPDVDAEARFVQADFGNLSIASIYLPSGSSSEERQRVKFAFLERFAAHLQVLRRKRRQYILCGDWNIAHKPVDLKNWRANQKNSGFLPEERAWMDRLIDEIGYVDAFRAVNQEPDQYTWWSARGQAWAKNVGWRIDYQIVTPVIAKSIRAASIYRAQRFSDHAPLIVDYAMDLEPR